MNKNREGRFDYILYAKNKLKRKSKLNSIFKSAEENMEFLVRDKYLIIYIQLVSRKFFEMFKNKIYDLNGYWKLY